MAESGILHETLKLVKTKKKKATHFVLCNGAKARYLIDLSWEGKKRLSQNISAYSGKLNLLMRLLGILPFSVLKQAGVGYYAKVGLNPAIADVVEEPQFDGYNVIIGTYDEKQKLVFQCFKKGITLSEFVKVGNCATNIEMKAEIDFLEEAKNFTSFKIPELLKAQLISESHPFNIQITQEFVGEKVLPILTADIVQIYKEISNRTKYVDGIEYEFSHGDFAPWNIKKASDGYIVFDWEHCDYRVKGFDLMHYCVVSKMMLDGKSMKDAFNEGLEEISRFVPRFKLDYDLFEQEYKALRLE